MIRTTMIITLCLLTEMAYATYQVGDEVECLFKNDKEKKVYGWFPATVVSKEDTDTDATEYKVEVTPATLKIENMKLYNKLKDLLKLKHSKPFNITSTAEDLRPIYENHKVIECLIKGKDYDLWVPVEVLSKKFEKSRYMYQVQLLPARCTNDELKMLKQLFGTKDDVKSFEFGSTAEDLRYKTEGADVAEEPEQTAGEPSEQSQEEQKDPQSHEEVQQLGEEDKTGSLVPPTAAGREYKELYYLSGDTFKGSCLQGTKIFDGIGTRIYVRENGTESYAGNWVNHQKDGQGKHTWSLKNCTAVSYEGTWKADQYVHGTYTWRKHVLESYTGPFKNFLREGDNGEMKLSNGGRYKGSWKAGKPVKGVFTTKGGKSCNTNTYPVHVYKLQRVVLERTEDDRTRHASAKEAAKLFYESFYTGGLKIDYQERRRRLQEQPGHRLMSRLLREEARAANLA